MEYNNISIDEIWIRIHEHCPNGVIGIEWSGDIGFGRYELVLEDDGFFHAYTEGLDAEDNKEFTKKILDLLLDKIVVEE